LVPIPITVPGPGVAETAPATPATLPLAAQPNSAADDATGAKLFHEDAAKLPVHPPSFVNSNATAHSGKLEAVLAGDPRAAILEPTGVAQASRPAIPKTPRSSSLQVKQQPEVTSALSLLRNLAWQPLLITVWLGGSAGWFLLAAWRAARFNR